MVAKNEHKIMLHNYIFYINLYLLYVILFIYTSFKIFPYVSCGQCMYSQLFSYAATCNLQGLVILQEHVECIACNLWVFAVMPKLASILYASNI